MGPRGKILFRPRRLKRDGRTAHVDALSAQPSTGAEIIDDGDIKNRLMHDASRLVRSACWRILLGVESVRVASRYVPVHGGMPSE